MNDESDEMSDEELIEAIRPWATPRMRDLLYRFETLRAEHETLLAEHEALKAKYSRLAEICTRLVSSALPLIYCENGGSEIQNPKEKPRQS